MESAGGLGEMLGEGGRAGFDTGGSSIRKYTIPPKVWPLVVEMYEKAGGRGETGMSLKEFAFQYFNKAKGGRVGMMYGGDPGFAFSYGGSWADWKDNHASEMPLMDYINQKLPKARNPFTDTKYQDGGPVMSPDEFSQLLFQKPYDQLTTTQQQAVDDFQPGKAEGGRVPLLAGGLLRTGIMEVLHPLLKGTWKGTLGSYRDLLKRLGRQEVRADVDKAMPTIKSSRAINLAKSVREELLSKIRGYKEGFVGAIKSRKTGDQVEELKYLIKETKKDLKHIDDFILKKQAGAATKHAEGGRIGLAGGMSAKRIDSKKRDNYFRFNRDNYMNLVEYLQSEQAERDLEGAFKKGGKVKKGGIGDLLGEMYRLFEISPLLASPELMDVIQKIPFDKGGKVKKGGGPNMSRRSFLQLMGGLASLPIVGKYFKLGKPLKDITVKIKKASWNEDVDYGTSGNILFDFVGKSKVGRELIKKYLPKNYKKDWGMDPKDAYKIVKKAKDKGLNIKITEFADEASTTMKDGVVNPKWYLGGRTLDRQTQQRLYNEAQQRFKKQTSRENIKEHLEDTSFFENDMYRWPKPNYGGTPTRYTDEIIDLIEPVVKKAEGGSVGQPPIQLGPLDLTPRASGSFTEGQPYGPDTREKTWSDNIGIGGTLDLPGGFSLTGEYDKYRTKDRLYTVDDEYLDERVKDDHDRWRLGLQWKKKFAKGGKAWQPKSAPKLTTTIPPERGPTPQGLTYLTGDDIVQNIG